MIALMWPWHCMLFKRINSDKYGLLLRLNEQARRNNCSTSLDVNVGDRTDIDVRQRWVQNEVVAR